MARVAAGHLRLLLGMLRANRPWRLAGHLHRSLFAAFAVSAYVLVTPDVWRIADSLAPLRLVPLSVAAVVATVVSLIVGHRLWERSASPGSRPQVVLFNLATTLTVTLGVLVLYLAQLVVLLAAALILLTPSVLGAALHHHANLADYLKVVWLADVSGDHRGRPRGGARVRRRCPRGRVRLPHDEGREDTPRPGG